MHVRNIAPLGLVTVAMACVTPPAPPQPRTATTVNASFAKTWEAAIDIFGERNIQIKTIDRASGIVVAEPQRVGGGGGELADCGTDMGIAIPPTTATWNLLVRGDSSRSSAKATVSFSRTSTWGMSTTLETRPCSTRGTWETVFEREVKDRAEAKR